MPESPWTNWQDSQFAQPKVAQRASYKDVASDGFTTCHKAITLVVTKEVVPEGQVSKK